MFAFLLRSYHREGRMWHATTTKACCELQTLRLMNLRICWMNEPGGVATNGGTRRLAGLGKRGWRGLNTQSRDTAIAAYTTQNM